MKVFMLSMLDSRANVMDIHIFATAESAKSFASFQDAKDWPDAENQGHFWTSDWFDQGDGCLIGMNSIHTATWTLIEKEVRK